VYVWEREGKRFRTSVRERKKYGSEGGTASLECHTSEIGKVIDCHTEKTKKKVIVFSSYRVSHTLGPVMYQTKTNEVKMRINDHIDRFEEFELVLTLSEKG